MGFWLLIVLVSCVAMIFFFRWCSRKRFMSQRTPRQPLEVYEELQDQVSFEVFNEVRLKLGEVYMIEPDFIRRDDTLRSLSQVDSWDLGQGGDALAQWLEREKKLGAFPFSDATVLDLMKWVDASRKDK